LGFCSDLGFYSGFRSFRVRKIHGFQDSTRDFDNNDLCHPSGAIFHVHTSDKYLTILNNAKSRYVLVEVVEGSSAVVAATVTEFHEHVADLVVQYFWSHL
jgi:hypothetical protein